jgi:hypothetical protein
LDKKNAENIRSRITADIPMENHETDYLNSDMFSELLSSLLISGQAPVWMHYSGSISLRRMLSDALRYRSKELRHILWEVKDAPGVRFRVVELADFAQLLQACNTADIKFETELSMLQDLYQCLKNIRFVACEFASSAACLVNIFFNYWLNHAKCRITLDMIIRDLILDISRCRACSPEQVVAEFTKQQINLPQFCVDILSKMNCGENDKQQRHTMQTASRKLPEQARSLLIDSSLGVRCKNPVRKSAPFAKPAAAGLPPSSPGGCMHGVSGERPVFPVRPRQNELRNFSINNAGIVLLQGFIDVYFNRQGLIANGSFQSDEKQRAAVHYLQYLATGNMATEEPYLIMNKLLCGIAIASPIESGVEMHEHEIETAESLIRAVIDYWPAIGCCSIAGFQGNWLIRNGVLKETPEYWDLVVEKRAYDILLQRAPFSFSTINFSWMQKPIYVTWVA